MGLAEFIDPNHTEIQSILITPQIRYLILQVMAAAPPDAPNAAPADGESSFSAFGIEPDSDADSPGAINKFELRVALNTLGYEFTLADIERLVMELDPHNTGTIDYDDLAFRIHATMSMRDQIDRIQMAFDMLDEDRTGRITFKNLKKIAKELGEEVTDQQLHEMINEADVDNDGEISFEEFVALARTAAFA
jgi:Ca2+-binding EF-hand superfamily protein